jgi:HK97 gp10 family phage protein
MSKGVARIEGLKELQAKLRSIDSELPKAYRGVIRSSGNSISRDWKAQIPKVSGDARRSIRVRMDREGLTGRVYSNLFYLRFREFGTRHQPARPALFPAAERERPNLIANLSFVLREVLARISGR